MLISTILLYEAHPIWAFRSRQIHKEPDRPEGIAGLLAREGLPEIDDLLAGLREGNNPNVYEVDTPEELQAIYDKYSRGGEPATPKEYEGEMVKFPDGTTVGLRNDSKSGGPTVDIKQPGREAIKIHLP